MSTRRLGRTGLRNRRVPGVLILCKGVNSLRPMKGMNIKQLKAVRDAKNREHAERLKQAEDAAR